MGDMVTPQVSIGFVSTVQESSLIDSLLGEIRDTLGLIICYVTVWLGVDGTRDGEEPSSSFKSYKCAAFEVFESDAVER